MTTERVTEVPLTRAEIDAVVHNMLFISPGDPARAAIHANALRMLQAAQSLDDLRELQGHRGDPVPARRATDGLRRHASITDALAAMPHEARSAR